MGKKFLLMTFLVAIIGFCGTSLSAQNVAKVGNTEYATIDEAIAAWTNNTTLTLLADVTLSDVIKLSSTEYHILDLGNYTMTAASKKDAIQIVNNGRSSASYALDVKADATNPGGITATGKAVVRTAGKSGVKDRPIIRFYNGVFDGSYIVYHSGSNGTNCPQFQFHGGVFNGTIFTNRTLNQFYGGTFNGSLMMSVDSSAYTLIAGGTFKQLSNLYMSALNSGKFTIGSAKGVYDKEVYIDDNGNYVIAATEPAQGIEADVAKTPGTNDYLAYSKVATEGQLGYTDVYTALEKNTSATVTVYVEELDLEDSNFKGTIVVPEGEKITIVTAAGVTPTWTVSANNDAVTYTDAEGNELVKDENGSFVVPPVAKIGETSYETLQAAVDAVQNGQTITLLADAAEDVTIPAGVTFNGNGKAVGNITAAGTITFNGHTKATSFNVENTNTTINIVEGACLEITGSSRMVIGHGCTFNITGSIEDAKTADKAALTPSLVMPGASFTGAGVTFNVTNAYIKTTASYCSSSKSASSIFDFNIENSIWEQFGKLAFESQSVNATVNFDLVNSVLTTTSHLVFGVSRGEVVIDNSNVNVGTSRQIENQSTMTIKNGSVVNGAVATSSNAKNPGTIIVENATYAVTGEFSGSDLGTGTLIVKKGATVSAGSITKANIQIDATGMTIDDEINLTANLANHAGKLEVVNNDNLTAKIVDGKIVLAERPAAKIGNVEYKTLEAAFKAATSGCTIDILSDATVDYNWDARYTGGKFTVPVTINGNDKTIKFTASVNDNNYQAPFRFEADATVKGLIIDMSEVTDNRFRAISSKGNLTVDGCKFIGKDETLNCRAVIFGEGAGTNVGNLAIAITNSEFINWKRGITDNENAQDVKTVTITGNTLTDAGVGVSAKETVTFTGNTVAGAYVNIKSYTAGNKLQVTATGNTLEQNTDSAYNVIDAGGKVEAEGFKIIAKGNDFTGYTRGDAIWGEVWGNAKESFVIKVLDANGNVMGTTSLNNIGGIIDGDVNVTWNIKLDAASNTDEYWTMAWTTAPTIDNMPAKVELWVDGVKVSGGNVVLNGPDEIAKIYAAVTDASGKILGYHTDIQEAIKAAAAVTSVARTATAGTVEVLSDVTVDKWIMFAEKMSIGDGSLITLNINGVTIDGNNNTLTVKSIESAGNGGYLFYDAQNLTVKDLTINIADGLVGGIGLQSGTISNVTFNGGQYGVLPGKNGVTVSGCTFNDTKGYAVYYEDARPGIVVDGNTFNTAEGKYAITMRSDEQFTNNTITKGRVNLANSAASTVSGNDFGTERFKVYNGATATISNNKINNLVFNETTSPAASTFANNILSAEAQAAIDALPLMAGEGTEANPYTIGNLAQLKAFRDDVNAGNNYQGKFVKLTADIDLNNEEWTPIATFNGKFDGNDKTISNLVVNGEGKSNQGFFGQTNNGEIKNLKINNATVKGRLNVGVVAGTPYTSKYTNIKVTGDVVVEGMAYVGGVGGKNAYANWTDITVDVNDGSYVKATSTENGNVYRTYVGGVIGFNGEGGHTFKNISSNIKVIGDVMDIGGIFGILHYGNNAENITFEGAVEAPANAKEVGGIAGVWHNEKGQTVTITNAKSEGTVKVGDVTTTGSIVGGAYNADNKYEANSGSLIIDGNEAWLPSKVTTKAELNAALAVAKEGDIIVMDADIDYGTDQLAIAKAITLDLGGKTLTTRNAWGGMSIKNNPTVKNGTIVHASNTAAIKVWNATAFEDLVIDVQGKGDANKTIGGIVLQSGSTTKVGSIKNVTIKGAALTNGIETYNCGDATENVIGSMENVTIDAQGTGLLISAPCGTATNCNIYGGVTGIELWIKGNYSATLALVDSDVKGGEKPVYVHDEFSTNPDIQNNGTLALTANEATTFTSESGALAAVNIARAENADRTVVDKLIENAIVCVGDVYFDDFAKAWAAVKAGQTVTLLADIEASEVILIDKSLTINGNGHKVTSSANRVFRVTAAAEVTLDKVNMVSTAFSSYTNDIRGISLDGGVQGVIKLTLNNCSVDFDPQSGSDWAYAVNISGNSSGYALAINGGTYEGANVINVWGDNHTITIDGATLNNLYNAPQNGYFGQCVRFEGTGCETTIKNSVFNGVHAVVVGEKTPDANTVAQENNTDNTKTYDVKAGTKYYYTLAEAFAAVEDNATIEVLRDIEETETAVNTKNVVLDLNGKTVSMVYTAKATKNHTMVSNSGNLTIESSVEGGKLSYTYAGENIGTTYSANTVTSNPGSVLTVKSGTIENLTYDSGVIAYAIDGLTNGGAGDVTVNIEGGVITSKRQAVRIFANSTTNTGALNISGGEFTGRVIVQNASAKANKAALNITDGTFNANEYKTDVLYVGGSESATIDIDATVSGGTFKGDITDTNVKGFISGGTFKSTTDTELLAADYMFGAASNGYCGVVLEAGVAGSGTWGGIDWTLTHGGTLTIAPTAGTPVADKNSGKTYEVGAWREAVRYNSNGDGVAVEGWPYDRSKVKTLIIKEGVTSIGSFTAQSFTNLTGEVVIPSTVKYIGQEAFQKSTMTKLTFAAGGTEELCIAQGAFKNLIIEEVSLPADRPVHLHAWVFNNCHNLKTAHIPASVVSVHGTNHIDYFKDFNAHSNPTWTKSSEIFAYNEKMETITFGSEEVRDMFYSYDNNTSEKDYIVATVGLTSYCKIADAIAAVNENGGTIKLHGNAKLEDKWTIPAGKEVTLDLNGKTISQEKACTASYEMINNKGNLTITGEGKISFKDTSAGDPNFGWGSYTVRNEGNLVVENGTIEHLGEQAFAKHCIMAIFQYCGSTTINGGTISTPNYRSARLWKGDMTINGGTFDGQVWVQAVDNTAKLTVNGGTFAPNGNDASAVFVTNSQYDVQFAVTDGTFNGKVGCSDATKLAGAITGGKFTETAKNGTNAALLATGLAFGEADANGYYAVEDDPATHYIATLDELKAFRDAVNSGANYYAGVTVYLAADIDMAGENWVGIGTATADHGFMGNFDGNNFKIKNLTIDNPALDSDGYAYAGFFGVTEGTDKDNQNTIKNLTIENVTISTTGQIAAAAIAYPYYTIVDNVKVCGDIKINGGNYTAGVLAYTRRCVNASDLSIVGNEGSFVKGNQVVGGVISDIQMNGGLTAVYNNFSAEGITVSGKMRVGGISGIIATQTLNGATVKNVTLNSEDKFAGVVAGCLGGTSTITNVFAENVTGATALIGATYDAPKAVQAKIGDTYYATLEAALAAQGEATVELLAPVTVATGETCVLNLNGKTVVATDNATGSYAMITNKGDLTINGEGAIRLTATNNRGWNAYSSVISNTVGGKLTVNGGTIEHLGGTDMAYGIDNLTNGKGTYAETVINGGYIKSTYRAIRQFLNGVEAQNILTVNGGTIEGANKSIWMQDPNKNANTGTLAVGENAQLKGDVYLYVTDGSTSWPVTVSIVASALQGESTVMTGNVPAGYKLELSDGIYGVTYIVATIGDNRYETLQAAITAAGTAETTINVIANTTENITIQEGANITLKFDGDITLNGYFAPFNGNLTIKGGTINNTNSGASAIEINSGKLNLNNVNIASARHAVRIDGAVIATINGGEYTLTATSGTRHTVNVSGGAEVTIKAGTFVGPKGTTMDSGSAVCVQAGAKVTIEGGDFSNGKNATLGVTGTMIVTGGTFDQDPSAYLAQGYITKYNETTSRYEVFKGVAKIENEYFASIQDAIDAAENNDVITVISDFEMDITSGVTNSSGYYVLANVANKAVVIDLNGKKVTVDVTNLPEGCKDNMLMSVFCADTDGNLTLKDSSNGNGSVSVTGGESKTVYSLVIAYGGLVNIEGGNYSVDYMPAGRGMIYGNVSDHSGADGSNVSKGANISGGNFTLGNVGTLANGSPWILATAGSNTGKYIFVTGGTYNADILHQHWIFEVVAPTNKALKNNGNGTYTIVDAVAFVKHHEYDGYYSEIGYATLEEAFEIAETGDVVTLVTNVELENTITVNAGKDVILDLNGKIISGVCNSGQGHMFMVQNTADLTIKDSSENEEGKIIYSRGTSNTGWVIDLEGDLILESGTIELTGDSWSIGYAVDVRPNSWGSEYTEATTFTMSGGKLVSSDAAVRVASSSADNHENVSANFIMNGGEIEAAWDGIFVQQSNAAYDILNVRINGGNIKSALPLRLYGPAATSVLNNVENPITLNITDGTFDYTGNDLEDNKWLVPGVIMVAGGATFEEMLGYTDFEITGGTFEGDVNAYCAEGFAATNNDNGTWTVMPAQKQSLVKGWNWYSTYLDIETADLTGALGSNGDQIKNQDGGKTFYVSQRKVWEGSLTLEHDKMYMINVLEACSLQLAADVVDATSYDINLRKGWSWIGYPSNQEIDINTALANFEEPNEGDRIKSQYNGYAEYRWGKWRGTLKTLVPGIGYMYNNKTEIVKSFRYNFTPETTSRGAVEANVTAENNYWTPDATKYPFNMTMTAVVDGLADANYEVAAFVNGEVRGSARPIYIEEIDAYVLFLTIHGEDVEEMSFRLYDIDNDTEYDLSDRINYSNNAEVGSLDNPYTFSRGTTGIGEASMSEVNIYPNPTTTGTEINLEATCDKVEVFNALGVKVAEYQNVDTIDALETAGIYVIRITNNGNVQNCRLVVK